MGKRTEAAKAAEAKKSYTVEVFDREGFAVIMAAKAGGFAPKGQAEQLALSTMLEELDVFDAYSDHLAGVTTELQLQREFGQVDKDGTPSAQVLTLTAPTVEFYLDKFTADSVAVPSFFGAMLAKLTQRIKEAKRGEYKLPAKYKLQSVPQAPGVS